MPKTKLDEITEAIFGDHDDGFGVTYSNEEDEPEHVDDDSDGLDREWQEIMSGRAK
jgi:hypothetical protein